MGYSTSVVYGADFNKLGKDKKKPLIPTNKSLDLKTKTVYKTKNKKQTKCN